MSYYPIQLDKSRNFKYGMRAIDLLEKKYKKPMGEIEGIKTGVLSQADYATIMWAGLVHEERALTPDKIMDLVDEYSSLKEVTGVMWKALNEVFATDDEEDEEQNEDNEEVEVKNALKVAKKKDLA